METRLLLLGDEYETVIRALEFMISACPEEELPEAERIKAYRALERLLVEAGDVTPAELREIRERFKMVPEGA